MKLKRRAFLKLIGVSMVAPSILAVAPKPLKALNCPPINYQQRLDELTRKVCSGADVSNAYLDSPIGFALEYIPKGKFGYIQLNPIKAKDFYK